MERTLPATGALTSLDAALAALVEGLVPVAADLVPLEAALGRIAAETPSLETVQPPRDTAIIDGWACRALDLVGASAYSPLALANAPAWVEAGDVMPDGCDCVLGPDLVDRSGPITQAVGEAAPGQGVRRAGEDMAAGRPLARQGRALTAADLLAARKAGVRELAVRSPRVRVVDVAAASGETFSTRFVADRLKASGATVAAIESAARDPASIASALDGEPCDLIVFIGGTGEGRTDATAEALALREALIVHRLALRPGGTTAIGRFDDTPVIALSGLADHALAGSLAFVEPALDRLSGRSARTGVVLQLSRKISSAVGLCEIVLLAQEGGAWSPLAVGDFPLETIRMAEAWLAVPGGSEGYAAGSPVAANPLSHAS